jgi:pyridoxamine 5'-phosphate oxidase
MSETLDPALKLSLADLRENYTRGALDESTVNRNPVAQFEQWFQESRRSGLKEPNAMTLATASPDGRPCARIVLLKEVSENGFVFFTNRESRKGRELSLNPQAALVFYWAELERQVRIEGAVSPVDRARSEQYFRARPKGSRLGALASRQSEIVQSRTILEVRLSELEARYQGTDDVPMPECWGGYCVAPQRIEFWQGRPNRLHDRLSFERETGNTWRLERLSP